MRLLRAYQQASPESGRGVDALERWLAIDPNDLEARRMLGQILESQGKSEQAVAQYEIALAAGTDDPVALNNLAWHYLRQGDPRAAEMAARAYELLPQNGSITDTYGWVLFKQGDYDRSLELLEKAASLSPDNSEIQFHLAAVYAKMGNQQRASEILEPLLSSNDDFPSRAQAEELAGTL